MKESAIGIALGLILGLPQGMSDNPMLSKINLPIETLLVIGIFGLFSGYALAFSLLRESKNSEYSIGGYFCFMVGSLSIGFPNFVRHYSGNLTDSLTITGLFFSAIGLSMLISGALNYVYSKNT